MDAVLMLLEEIMMMYGLLTCLIHRYKCINNQNPNIFSRLSITSSVVISSDSIFDNLGYSLSHNSKKPTYIFSKKDNSDSLYFLSSLFCALSNAKSKSGIKHIVFSGIGPNCLLIFINFL